MVGQPTGYELSHLPAFKACCPGLLDTIPPGYVHTLVYFKNSVNHRCVVFIHNAMVQQLFYKTRRRNVFATKYGISYTWCKTHSSYLNGSK